MTDFKIGEYVKVTTPSGNETVLITDVDDDPRKKTMYQVKRLQSGVMYWVYEDDLTKTKGVNITDFKTWKTITGQDLEEQIHTIISCFDFEKVHKVMLALDWRWYSSQTENQVPSYGELVLKARQLIYQAFDRWLEYGWQKDYTTGTGGFQVELQRTDLDYITIDLKFIVAEWNNRE